MAEGWGRGGGVSVQAELLAWWRRLRDAWLLSWFQHPSGVVFRNAAGMAKPAAGWEQEVGGHPV